MRRKDLPASVERHLIEPRALDPGWRDRIRTLWAAWTAEVDWRQGVDAEPTIDDAVEWAETAREFCALARDAIVTDGIELDDPDEAGTSANATDYGHGSRRSQKGEGREQMGQRSSSRGPLYATAIGSPTGQGP